ncbi:phosphoenolpyruvate carboxykinase [GTP] [Ditylenchus destructor]|nr:phosphoenolpyruvate carboxykinase [GTP] [Ditylenchus destructor]
MPKIFFVNWYRRDINSGKLLWPGFGENIRVLDWIARRLVNTSEGSQVRICDFLETPLGYQPSEESFNLKGLNVDWSSLNSVSAEFWQKECDAIEAFFVQQMGKNTPPEITRELEKLRRNIKDDHYKQNKY